MRMTPLFITAVLLITGAIVPVNSVNAQYGMHSAANRHYQGANFIKGRVLARPNAVEENAVGTPLLNPEWGTGTVFTPGGNYSQIEIQYNKLSNELYYKKGEEVLVFVDTVNAFVLTYADNDQVKTEKYQAGYPSIGDHNYQTFYQVLEEGPRFHLLNRKYSKRQESYHYSEGKTINYFSHEDLYVYDVSAKKIAKIKKSESSLTEAFPDKAEEIKKVAGQQKLKLKNQEDLVKLVKLLNT